MSLSSSILMAFLAGGVICIIAQLLIDLTKLTPARILVSYVSFGVFMYAVGIYDPLFDVFGCGVSVPLIGFGASIGRGVEEAIKKDGVMGIFSGGLSATAAGITIALISGLFFALFTKGKSKRL